MVFPVYGRVSPGTRGSLKSHNSTVFFLYEETRTLCVWCLEVPHRIGKVTEALSTR